MSSPEQRTGSTATAPPRRRRPVWAWLLLALLAIIILIAILLLAGRCGSDSTAGGPPTPPAPTAAGAPGGAPGPAPGGAPGAAAPGTPGGPAGGADPAAVQSRIDQIVAADPITFRPNSAELTESGAASVQRVAGELQTAPSVRAVVTGYSATLGGPGTPDPQQLSDQRATTVADRLATDGVARDRLQTRGASDTNPLADPAASRRAEISVS